ncbi:MAG TPA: hypothetical protein VGP63_07470 [Planctomycetaceae bacterium]|jgi:hypothetical protein|nr:hypothetical protein [Planctomycetaceae bacterium]
MASIVSPPRTALRLHGDELPEGKDVPVSRVPTKFSRPNRTPLLPVEAGARVAIEIEANRKAP